MPVCENIDFKYLKEYESGVAIKINRAGIVYIKKFTYRSNNGFDNTWKVARKHRDEKYLELFGVEISKGFFHIKKKKGSKNNDLPPGLSLEYSRKKPLYITASWCDENSIVHRQRFNIKKEGYDEAKRKAEEFILNKRKLKTKQ